MVALNSFRGSKRIVLRTEVRLLRELLRKSAAMLDCTEGLSE